MREYAWYCAELDMIAIQVIPKGFQIEFISEAAEIPFPMSYYCWIPLGEV
jgi:hypothetical protein